MKLNRDYAEKSAKTSDIEIQRQHWGDTGNYQWK